MAKKKLFRFAENKTFPNLIQAGFYDIQKSEFSLKGNWKNDFFKNQNPIVLELGCGKGEYTIGLAKKYPDKNFIGIDIKGARLWTGAKTGVQENITNAGFIRTRIDLLNSFFAEGEVSEIWLTFPDPQKEKVKKRLSSPKFLRMYQKCFGKVGIVHLKTDSDLLYTYSHNLVVRNELEVIYATSDLYNSGLPDEILAIKTYYESIYLSKGKNINYLKFVLTDKELLEF